MKTMKWLIRRELWEHKGMLFWVPVAIALAVAALGLVSVLLGHNVQFNDNGQAASIGTITIEGSMRARIVDGMAQAYMLSSMPVLMILSLLVFFYCLGALHDERRDRSMLFWKSLPVSDLETVLSKVLLAVVVAPLITMAIGTILSLFMVLCAGIVVLIHGTNLFGALLATPAFYLAPLQLLGLLPVYILWALPTVGWLLMVSSLARSKVFLWAVGTPVVTGLLLVWAEKALHFGFDAGYYISNIICRILLGVIPGSWLGFSKDVVRLEHGEYMTTSSSVFAASWATLGTVSAWVGVAAGVAMIAVAVWVRRRREEG